jgi:hypothetical protein
MPTSQATATLTATCHPQGHLSAHEHRPGGLPRPVRQGMPLRPRAWMVDRRYYSPRVIDLGLPANN